MFNGISTLTDNPSPPGTQQNHSLIELNRVVRVGMTPRTLSCTLFYIVTRLLKGGIDVLGTLKQYQLIKLNTTRKEPVKVLNEIVITMR